jgi:hypothetical protein
MEQENYKDRAWELGYQTLELAHRMSNTEFCQLGEEMMKTAKLVGNGLKESNKQEIYDAYTRCLRLMSYLVAVEDMGIISSSEYRNFEIQLLSLTNRLQHLYKNSQC